MKIVVIGHGMVGHKFLESLADNPVADMQVTVLCEEPRPACDRVHLSEFFSGKSADDLSLVKPGFFERDDIVEAELGFAAFECADYLMDRLKTEALFWKREEGPAGTSWIEPTEQDYAERGRWE